MIIKRALALYIDFFIFLTPVCLYANLYMHKNANGGYPVTYLNIFIFISLYYYYLIIQEFYWQQTLGKRIFRLKIKKTDNSRYTMLDGWKRHFFDIIELFIIPIIAFIIVHLNKRQQRLGDLIAKTQVIESRGLATSV